jgi:predicted GH43/DUF377 family glycosyl hydrolase
LTGAAKRRDFIQRKGEGSNVSMERCWNDIDKGDEILREHERQCTYNVTLRRVRATTVAMYRVIHKSLRNFQKISCTTTKTDTAQRSISIGAESLHAF